MPFCLGLNIMIKLVYFTFSESLFALLKQVDDLLSPKLRKVVR